MSHLIRKYADEEIIFFCMFHPTKSWVYFCLILWYPVFTLGWFIGWILDWVGIAQESKQKLLLLTLLAIYGMYKAFKALWPSEVINELMAEANIALRQDNEPIIENFALEEAANILRERADQLDQNLQAHILRRQDGRRR